MAAECNANMQALPPVVQQHLLALVAEHSSTLQPALAAYVTALRTLQPAQNPAGDAWAASAAPDLQAVVNGVKSTTMQHAIVLPVAQALYNVMHRALQQRFYSTSSQQLRGAAAWLQEAVKGSDQCNQQYTTAVERFTVATTALQARLTETHDLVNNIFGGFNGGNTRLLALHATATQLARAAAPAGPDFAKEKFRGVHKARNNNHWHAYAFVSSNNDQRSTATFVPYTSWPDDVRCRNAKVMVCCVPDYISAMLASEWATMLMLGGTVNFNQRLKMTGLKTPPLLPPDDHRAYCALHDNVVAALSEYQAGLEQVYGAVAGRLLQKYPYPEPPAGGCRTSSCWCCRCHCCCCCCCCCY